MKKKEIKKYDFSNLSTCYDKLSKKMIQCSHKFKKIDKDRLLVLQNKQRKKYGLRPLKRIELETFLYFSNDDEQQKPQYINPKYDGGMYQ